MAKKEIDNCSPNTLRPDPLKAKIPKATPKLDPDEIPKTEGPANGFLNSVCISNPAKAIPAPQKMAVRVLGILNIRIFLLVSFEKSGRPSTEPNDIPKNIRRIKTKIIPINLLIKLMCEINNNYCERE